MIAPFLMKPYKFRKRAAIFLAVISTIYSLMTFPFQDSGSLLNKVDFLESNGLKIVKCIEAKQGFNSTQYDLHIDSPSKGLMIVSTQQDSCASWTDIENPQIAVLNGSVVSVVDGENQVVSLSKMMSTMRAFGIFVWMFLMAISFSYLDKYFGPVDKEEAE